jgi:hypothetical protein
VGSGNADAWSGRAFGLSLAGDLPLEGVVASPLDRQPDTRLCRVPRAGVDRVWRDADPSTLLERRLVDGRVGLSVQRDARLGFRVWAPRHGCYLVAPDGTHIAAAPSAVAAWRWERLLLAQVLPLAAALRGMEILHASAVEMAGRAVAFLGGSGVGKTTLAARIVARGARLVTDDVLAVDVANGAVRTHSGGAVARVDPRELRAMTGKERRGLGAIRARAEKWHVMPTLASDELPLALTYHLVRRPEVEEVEIVRVHPYDPALLLGSAFLSYLVDPERLRRQLDVCGAIADTTPLHQVRIGRGSRSAEVSEAVLEHASSALSASRDR